MAGVAANIDERHAVGILPSDAAVQPPAESVLSGHQRLGPPNQKSTGVAQAAEITRCGREDSNLHECYLTRSLADLADQKANEFKGASRSGTPENTLGRPHFSPVVKNRARDLLRAVANGGDVPIASQEVGGALLLVPAGDWYELPTSSCRSLSTSGSG